LTVRCGHFELPRRNERELHVDHIRRDDRLAQMLRPSLLRFFQLLGRQWIDGDGRSGTVDGDDGFGLRRRRLGGGFLRRRLFGSFFLSQEVGERWSRFFVRLGFGRI
jgi:hypothetical protein